MLRLWWLVYLWPIWVHAQHDNAAQPTSIFRSRLDLEAPVLIILDQSREQQAPGYYFVAPYQQNQATIHIYDNDANLVYTGFGSAGAGVSHSPQVCQYQGEPHLCFYQGQQMMGWGHGHGLIMDKHYRIVQSVESGSYQASSDMHEFFLINNGTSALMTQYLRSAYDLCRWDLCDGLGYIQQGAFEEVDVKSSKVVFEWSSLDHIHPNNSFVLPGTTEISGSGEQVESPWDYFHINSVDKNADGDYLISARHTSAVYKISGVDGHVMWTLGGINSDFAIHNFSFSFQHDARFIADNSDATVISLFDNGSNGFNQTQPHSTGLIIEIDHHQRTAIPLKIIDPPFIDGHAHISKSQGNLQILPDGGMVMGWGNDPFWTEYDRDGNVVFYGKLAERQAMNYRVHKFDNWVGLPLTRPALWTYSEFGTSEHDMQFYVSWNGATEVRHWRFYLSQSRRGPYQEIATVSKDGFETMFTWDEAASWAYAEALDKDYQVLGTTEKRELFVPSEPLRPYCDGLACRFMPDAATREQEKIAQLKAMPTTAGIASSIATQSSGSAVNRTEDTSNEKETSPAAFGGVFVATALVVVALAYIAARSFISRPIGLIKTIALNTIRRHSLTSKEFLGYKFLDDQDPEHGRVRG